jgi:hypothetical protein
MCGDNDNNEVAIKVPITEYTQHIVKEAVTEAMKQHQDSCPLVKAVTDLSSDMWGTDSKDGVKNKVRILQDDLVSRKENVNFIKRPIFSGIVGAVFVGFGFFLKGAWLWFTKKN